MNFLDQVFFENTVRQYLIVVAVILFVVLFKRYLSRYLAALIYELVRRNWPVINKQQFLELIVKPLSYFLLIVISVMVIDILHFPSLFDIKIYHTTLGVIVEKIGVGLIVMAIVNLLVSTTNFIALLIKDETVSKDERAQHQLIFFFKDFIKAIFYIVGLILILKFVFAVNIGTLLGGIGIAGAALALAARESIENIIASFIIFLDKPFFTGDQVKVNAYSGRVERIGLRSTRIRTQDKTLITVPNKQMVDSIVDNLSFRNFRRGEIKLELPSNYNSDRVREFVKAANELLNKKKADFTSCTADVTEYSKSGITVLVEFFTIPIPAHNFVKLKQEIMLSLMELMEDQQAEFSQTPPEPTVVQPNAGVPPQNNRII